MTSRDEAEKIRRAIRGRYAEVSKTARGRFAYLTGAEGARALGYDPSILSRAPADLLESFCGVGNPFLGGPIEAGEILLDVGCGAGFDLLVARHHVGETGRVCGIDITPEMRAVAKGSAMVSSHCNIEVREGDAASIPYEDKTFHVVISNGVLNLSTDKEAAFTEIFRVLRPGGRLQFADIVLEGEEARDTPCTLEAWSD